MTRSITSVHLAAPVQSGTQEPCGGFVYHVVNNGFLVSVKKHVFMLFLLQLFFLL